MSEDYDIVEHVKWAAKGWRQDDAMESRDPETEAAFCDKIASEITRLRGEVERPRGAISWITPPFVDADTTEAELRKRVQFVNDDLSRALSSAPKPEG